MARFESPGAADEVKVSDESEERWVGRQPADDLRDEVATPLRERIRADLKQLGVSSIFRDAMLGPLEKAMSQQSPESYQALLMGVAIAQRGHKRAEDSLHQGFENLREVQQLMDSFGGELKKLDEAVKILAAYVERMRSRANPAPDQIVH